jgi:hypothetical protein
MNPAQILAWREVTLLLLQAGVASLAQIRAFITLVTPGVTDDELNLFVRETMDDAARRKAMAEADAGRQT